MYSHVYCKLAPEYKIYNPESISQKTTTCSECNSYFTNKGCAFFIPLEKPYQNCNNVIEVLRRKKVISNVVSSRQVTCNKYGCIVINACSVITNENKDFCNKDEKIVDQTRHCNELKQYILDKLLIS